MAEPTSAPAPNRGPAAAVEMYRPTAREVEIMRLTAMGLTYEAMARRTAAPFNSVKTWSKLLFRRTGVSNQAELVHWAWVHGYLGDRNALLERNDRLRNQVTNLQSMYRVAVSGGYGASRRDDAEQVRQRAEADLRKAREALRDGTS